MHDTEKVTNATQGKLLLLRHCANTIPSHWLQLTAPAAAARPALLHDSLVSDALVPIICPHAASAAERARGLERATFPLSDHGGLGLHSAHRARPSHYVGRFAADWLNMCSHFPTVAALNLTTQSHPDSPHALPSLIALSTALDSIYSQHASTAARYAALDSRFYDFDTFGDKTYTNTTPSQPPHRRLPPIPRPHGRPLFH